MSNVSDIAEKSGSASMRSPVLTLEAAINDVSGYGRLSGAKKVLVLILDDREGRYELGFQQAGMSMSEMVSLCEAAKMAFFTEMGFIPE